MAIPHLNNPVTVAKQAIRRKNKLSIKERKFAREYAKNGNGTQSVIKAGYNVGSEATASVIATQNLAKLKIKEEVKTLLADNDIELPEILSTHKRNMLQTKNLPTSQKAVVDFYDILGMRSNEHNNTAIKIGLVVER